MARYASPLPIAWLLVVGAPGCDPAPAAPDPAPSPVTTNPVRSSSPTPSTTPPIPIPPSLSLSGAERDALQQLARAPHFGGWAVGVAGTPTKPVAAWRVLLASPRATEAFALVLEHGTLAGQLMALAGLYQADPERFRRELPRYRQRREKVRVMTSGCAPGGDPVIAADLVESPKAVRLEGPDDTLSAWSQRNPTSTLDGFDIVGGGYSAVMKPYRPPSADAGP